MRTKYEVIIYWSADDEVFIAEAPELPGCMADGHTRQEALANLEVVIQEWTETATELRRPIPEPRGRLMFALPAALTRAAAIRRPGQSRRSRRWSIESASGLGMRWHNGILTLRRFNATTCSWRSFIMGERTVRSTVYFEKVLHKALRLKAASTDCSVSELVNDAVRLALREDQEDLAAFEKRAVEPTISYEELLTDLKAHGKL